MGEFIMKVPSILLLCKVSTGDRVYGSVGKNLLTSMLIVGFSDEMKVVLVVGLCFLFLLLVVDR